MPEPEERGEQTLDPASRFWLDHTRSSVLNVLVAICIIIAATGTVLKNRPPAAPLPDPRTRDVLLAILFVIFVASTILRRVLGHRSRLRDPETRGILFYRAHLVPSLLGILAAVLGLLYGLRVSTELRELVPFSLTALIVGILSFPRAGELADFDKPMVPEGTTPS